MNHFDLLFWSCSVVFQLFRLWKQEKGKREQSYIECTYYLEKAKQLENEMKQLIDVSYSVPVSITLADQQPVGR